MVRIKMDKKGFTFVELMVVLFIASIVMASIYSVFRSQMRSHVTQQAVVDMQQNVRNAMFYLRRSILMVGYDPVGSAGAGFVNNFDTGFHPVHVGKVAQTDSENIAFTIDDDGDGIIDHCLNQVSPMCPDDPLTIPAGVPNPYDMFPEGREMVAFRLNNGNLERYRAPNQTWEIVAENLESINFNYLDQDGIPTADLAQVRSVEITIVARPDNNPLILHAENRRNQLTSIVHCRNLSLN